MHLHLIVKNLSGFYPISHIFPLQQHLPLPPSPSTLWQPWALCGRAPTPGSPAARRFAVRSDVFTHVARRSPLWSDPGGRSRGKVWDTSSKSGHILCLSRTEEAQQQSVSCLHMPKNTKDHLFTSVGKCSFLVFVGPPCLRVSYEGMPKRTRIKYSLGFGQMMACFGDGSSPPILQKGGQKIT